MKCGQMVYDELAHNEQNQESIMSPVSKTKEKFEILAEIKKNRNTILYKWKQQLTVERKRRNDSENGNEDLLYTARF